MKFVSLNKKLKAYFDVVRFPPNAQKMKFSIKDFSSKRDQIRRKLQFWSDLLEKSLMENFIFCAVKLGS